VVHQVPKYSILRLEDASHTWNLRDPFFWLERTSFLGGQVHAWIPGVILADTSHGKKPAPFQINKIFRKQLIFSILLMEELLHQLTDSLFDNPILHIFFVHPIPVVVGGFLNHQ